MTPIQKLFIFCFFTFAAIFTQNSYAQTAPENTRNFERKHIATVSHDPTTGSTTEENNADESNLSIAGLPDGMNIVAQTREHILLAVIMEKGRMKSIGSIDLKGNFHRFELDTPCGNYLAAPCRDGSKPSVYFDPYIKECVGVCNNVIDLDPAGYKPLNPYGLRPNGPCSDYIAQPCPTGTTLVMYYNPYTDTCTSYCDY